MNIRFWVAFQDLEQEYQAKKKWSWKSDHFLVGPLVTKKKLSHLSVDWGSLIEMARRIRTRDKRCIGHKLPPAIVTSLMRRNENFRKTFDQDCVTSCAFWQNDLHFLFHMFGENEKQTGRNMCNYCRNGAMNRLLDQVISSFREAKLF
jgi:hypothetical protein